MSTGRPRSPRLPSWPLVRYVRARGLLAGVTTDSTEYRGFYKAQQLGEVTHVIADRLAVRLCNVHPVEIWPEWFDASIG